MSVSLCLATQMTNLIRYVLIGINDRDRFAFGASGPSQVHTSAGFLPKISKAKGVWHECIVSALLWLADRGNPLLCWQFISLQASSGSAGTLSQRVSPGSGWIKPDNFLLAVWRDSAT
jgi:hypothetical protein